MNTVPEAVTPLVAVTNCTMDFPGVKALSDVDFTLLPGECHVLVGENGGFAFMIGEVVNCGLMVLSVYVAARMERGIVTGVIAGSSLFNLRWKR